MTELAGDAPREPKKPPNPRLVVAVCLELGIVGTLVAHHSVLGLVLCVAYAWFSATWSFFQWLNE